MLRRRQALEHRVAFRTRPKRRSARMSHGLGVDQWAHPHQVESRRGEGKHPLDARAAAMSQLAQQRNGFHPAKRLLDLFAFPLTDRIAAMPGGTSIDRTVT